MNSSAKYQKLNKQYVLNNDRCLEKKTIYKNITKTDIHFQKESIKKSVKTFDLIAI